MFRKRKQLKKDAKAFSIIVAKLWHGIHLIDGMIEMVDSNADFDYKTTCSIVRSLEDTISLIHLYKDSRFFHAYNNFMMEQGVSMLTHSMSELEGKSRKFDDIRMKISQINTQLGSIDEEEIDAELQEKIDYINHTAVEMMRSIHHTYMLIRSTLLGIRVIVSKDYMMLMTGVDIIQAYQYDEMKMKQELRHIVRFDRIEFLKMKKGADRSESGRT